MLIMSKLWFYCAFNVLLRQIFNTLKKLIVTTKKPQNICGLIIKVVT